MPILGLFIGIIVGVILVKIIDRLDYGIYCENCGTKKIKKPVSLYNEYTGIRKHTYSCPVCNIKGGSSQ